MELSLAQHCFVTLNDAMNVLCYRKSSAVERVARKKVVSPRLVLEKPPATSSFTRFGKGGGGGGAGGVGGGGDMIWRVKVICF